MPAKSAWLPAESTEVNITVFMKDAAISMPKLSYLVTQERFGRTRPSLFEHDSEGRCGGATVREVGIVPGYWKSINHQMS